MSVEPRLRTHLQVVAAPSPVPRAYEPLAAADPNHGVHVELVMRKYALLKDHLRAALEQAMDIGDELRAARENCPHGEWESWVNATFPFSHRMANNYIRLAQNRKRISDSGITSIRQGLSLIKEPRVVARLARPRSYGFERRR